MARRCNAFFKRRILWDITDTQNQKKACNKRYLRKFEKITFRVIPEEKAELERRAAQEGKSINQYLKDTALGEKWN